MSASEFGSLKHERGEFMATAAFSTYTDVNDRLLDTLNAQPIAQIDPDAYENYRKMAPGGTYPEDTVTDQTAKSLYVTMTHFRELVSYADGFPTKQGFTEQDKEQALQHSLYSYGLGNMDFPWHFSAGVANAVADFFVDEGVVTRQLKEAFRLHDWASMIESEWFGKLTNDLALTARHLHRLFGCDLKHYRKNALQEYLHEELSHEKRLFQELNHDKGLFQLEWIPDQRPEEITPIATLDKRLRHTLRERMRLSEQVLNEQSAGCPVARKVVSLSVEAAESDPHIKSLVERGTLRRMDRSSGERVFFQQDNTTIDRTLGLIANQMRRYETTYGTPRLVDSDNSIWPRIIHQSM
jgi:hypothetical protein